VCDSESKAHLEAALLRLEFEALKEAFDFLYSALRVAKHRFETGNDAGRDGAIHALETVTKFLMMICEPVRSEALHAPLAALFDALMHLDDGETHPMLHKAKLAQRARSSAGRDSLKGAVAFTVDRLRALGVAAPTAHRDVARVLATEGVAPARGKAPTTARTVRLWCENVSADVGRHGEAAKTFDGLVNEYAACNHVESATELLDRLANLIRATRSAKPLNPPS
jgi:hypothetical protein